MASVSLTSLSPSGEEATTKGHLGGFCENSEDILMAGGDFDGDGLADLACRQLKHDGSENFKMLSVKFGKLV